MASIGIDGDPDSELADHLALQVEVPNFAPCRAAEVLRDTCKEAISNFLLFRLSDFDAKDLITA